MFDWLKKKKAPLKVESLSQKSEKDLATERGEPYVNVVSIDIDSNDVGNGAFELDWNDIFIARLVKSGFQMKKEDTDADIVDRWFQSVCRNILNENFEQWEANQPYDTRPRRVDRNDLGNGRTEVS
ncbi:hypothetical protein UFOVP257_373 [uncultured Caudovirales phage]|uniref:Uncharacterized protein n=1 Tax=uncultured Caudovirales phage TaxID=2100421 RepID=A0A6J5LHI4_9CAUD|nr:hypothetical protein UFOVP257_373 [uncultured Caudovirales phage]